MDAPGSAIDLERQTLHVMDDQRRVAMVETKTVDTTPSATVPTKRWRFQLDNHLGSAMLEVDAQGNIVSYEEYHPYGTSALRLSNGDSEVSAKRYRYTGQERDEETSLYYNGARYHAPWLGRWTAADPLGIEQPGRPDLNLYSYVAGRVIIQDDPSGHEGLFKAFVESVKQGDFSPSSPFAQKLVRGTYVGSSIVQDDKKLATAQKVAMGVAIVAGSIATGGAAAEIATAYGASAGVAGAVGGVAGGAYQRAATTSVEGGTPGESLKAAANPRAVIQDATVGGAIGVTVKAASVALPRVVSGLKSVVSRPIRRLPTVVPETPVGEVPVPAAAEAPAVPEVAPTVEPTPAATEAATQAEAAPATGKAAVPGAEGGEAWNERGGVDFANSSALYPVKPGQQNIVNIEYTGARSLDFKAANQAANLPRTPKGYTWHHLDDYNPATNRGTMQLVETPTHQANAPHSGGVKQFEQAAGKKYGR